MINIHAHIYIFNVKLNLCRHFYIQQRISHFVKLQLLFSLETKIHAILCSLIFLYQHRVIYQQKKLIFYIAYILYFSSLTKDNFKYNFQKFHFAFPK